MAYVIAAVLVHPPFISQPSVSYSVDCKSRSYDPDVSRDTIAFISQPSVSYSVDCKSRSYDPDVSRDT